MKKTLLSLGLIIVALSAVGRAADVATVCHSLRRAPAGSGVLTDAE